MMFACVTITIVAWFNYLSLLIVFSLLDGGNLLLSALAGWQGDISALVRSITIRIPLILFTQISDVYIKQS